MRWTIATLCLLLAGCASPPTDTPANVELHVLQALDDAWTPDARTNTRPATVPVRFVLPNGWGYVMQQCMVDVGYSDYTFSRADGFSNNQRAASRTGEEGLAWYDCGKRFPEYDVAFTRLDDGQVDALFAYYRDWLLPCLAAHGVAVENVPTIEQFRDGDGGQPGSWNPYLDSARPTSITAVDVQFAACPPYPPKLAEAGH